MILIGIIGMILILVAFIADEFLKNFNQDTVRYNLTNIFGSALLIWYAFTLNSWPFIILNVVWFLSASIKLYEIKRK